MPDFASVGEGSSRKNGALSVPSCGFDWVKF